MIYWLCWPIPAILIGCAAFNKEMDREMNNERYVVKNKYIKVKRRKLF